MLKKGSRAVLQDFLEKFRLFSGTFDGLWTNWGIGELNLRAGNPHTSKYKPWRIKTAIAFSDRQKAIDF